MKVMPGQHGDGQLIARQAHLLTINHTSSAPVPGELDTTRSLCLASHAFIEQGPSVRRGRRWPGSNLRQKGPCKSQGGFSIYCVTDVLDT
ncbi:hypothetical protein PoB_001014500 [Plakobranchus ocellatus]|uniref:Uncharacterized protein n=1 Tax=Plakobranchus ocellatus TaxID=259542 RepID=A0AAV3YLN7_9GAST|nr:hypothetical protein PoB_001014500 [Plakobranchus ocellatus]